MEGWQRAVVILAVAVLAHLVVRAGRLALDRVLGPPGVRAPARARAAASSEGAHPKLATILSLVFSTLTFVIWFVAGGLVLSAFGIEPTTYFATATVIGLAVGFGSQGLVQDVVIGLTLIFTDALDVGDMVEVAGQVGRVERVGLRFTLLSNFLGQTVYIPNRNIAVVGRYRRGVVRAYIDVQVPGSTDDAEADRLAGRLMDIARGFRSQHPAAVVSEPELMGFQDVDAGAWRFIRIKLRIWPGQQPLVETVLRQRVLAFMRGLDEKYADWMVPVTYRT